MLSQAECTCRCHSRTGVTHEIACCDGLPVDFWEKEYDPHFERKPASRRSAHFESPDDWMCFINSSKTGLPLR